uniref:HIG1 domain-containing protein n=1 Tax=Panagrellus redivivus TaxID=6233 RepID=A0A7E4W7X0_PANRE
MGDVTTSAGDRKSFLTWRVEPRAGPKEHQQVSSRSFDTVPMLPSDVLASGGDSALAMNPVVKNALLNPFVPVGMLATVGCLCGMFKATLNRNQYRAQLYMRGRVGAQFFTVCVLVGGALWLGFNPGGLGNLPGAVPNSQDSLTKRILNRD